MRTITLKLTQQDIEVLFHWVLKLSDDGIGLNFTDRARYIVFVKVARGVAKKISNRRYSMKYNAITSMKLDEGEAGALYIMLRANRKKSSLEMATIIHIVEKLEKFIEN